MTNKIYVGNLPHSVTDGELQNIFESHGTVQSAQVIVDKYTGRSKGFGFVEMGSDEEAETAINALNGTDVGGRPLTVNVARPRTERPSGGGSRGGPRGGNDGNRGGGYGGGGRRY